VSHSKNIDSFGQSGQTVPAKLRKEASVSVSFLVVIGFAVLSAATGVAQTSGKSGAPETFSASTEIKTASGPISATIQVRIRRFTPEFDRTALEDALQHGGYASFVNALRRAPEVGSVAAGDGQFTIRYAREQKTDKGRTIVVVTDKPVFFVGGARPNAKPRAGYETALIQLQVDDAGGGTGLLAAAARVKPGGETGVRIDNYADEPLALKVTRQTP
jgi:hypothetical protein